MDVKSYRKGGVRRADARPQFQGIGPGHISIWLRDVGGNPLHWQVTGGVPPQGVPSTAMEATL